MTDFLIAIHFNSISVLKLQRQLGVGSYRSATLLCGELHRSMVGPGRSGLTGLIEDHAPFAYKMLISPGSKGIRF